MCIFIPAAASGVSDERTFLNFIILLQEKQILRV